MAEKNKDLELIKKKYGEKMSHLCRSLFPTLLETEGLLPKLMLSKFNPDKSLHDIIVKENKQEDFKNYIYSLVDVENDNEIIVNKTPKELLDEAGYDFYECKSEKDIQSFKKYYASGEALCTFNNNRLDTNHVFWAVKKNVDEIKRENFEKPTRQDEYGTSVISIQFSLGAKNKLSIKNRYNHKVNNPDATFSNNLDSIIAGLNKSFEENYALNVVGNKSGFELPKFVMGNDRVWYRYNYEINNIYYCPNNIIINNGEVTKLDSEKQILIDYFVVNLSGENKGVQLYDEKLKDSFPDSFSPTQKISIIRKDNERKVIITSKDGDVTIGINQNNQITSLDNPYVTKIGVRFLHLNRILENVSLQQATYIGDAFLINNRILKTLSLPNATHISYLSLKRNENLKNLFLPRVTHIGIEFLFYNKTLEIFYAPNIFGLGCLSFDRHEIFRYLTPEQIREQSRKLESDKEFIKLMASENNNALSVPPHFKGLKNRIQEK